MWLVLVVRVYLPLQNINQRQFNKLILSSSLIFYFIITLGGIFITTNWADWSGLD